MLNHSKLIYDLIMQSFGQSIRELRLKKGSNFQDIASYLDISPEIVNNIEKDRVIATKNQVFKLANYFGVDAKDLLIVYQKQRMMNEEVAEKSETRSCLVKNREVASKRYQNMRHELQQLSKGKLHIEVHKPAYPLSLYIESMTFYDGHNFGCASEKVMPDGTVQLFVDLDNNERQLTLGNGLQSSISVKDAWITGIQKQHMTYQLKPSQTTLSIRFYPGGFYALTNIPQSEIENAAVNADVILGRSVAQLRENISCGMSTHEIFKKTENYFKKKMKQPDIGHSVISYICNHIFDSLPFLVQKTGYSQKHLIHLFKKHVGVTPKYFQRISRFNKVLNDIQAMQREIDWVGIFFDNHYFDQAHFIKEFTHFTGFSPQSYIETGSTCTRLIYTH